MKIAAWVAAAVFVFSAALQWNDPDPLRWILAYSSVAVLSGAFALGYPVWIPAALAAPAFAVLAFAVAPESLAASLPDLIAPEMKTLPIEEARELLGLGLCAAWCTVLAVQGRASAARGEQHG